MPKPKVLATHSLFEPARQILQENCEVEYWAKPGRPPREEVLRRVKDKEGLICLPDGENQRGTAERGAETAHCRECGGGI